MNPMLRWTRETRLLVVTVVLSTSVLLALARLRFPGREPTERLSLPARPLQQLAERASFDDLAATVARVAERVRPALIVVPLARPDRAPRSLGLADLVSNAADAPTSRRALAIHAGDGRFVAIASDAAHEDPVAADLRVVARDALRGLLIVSREDNRAPVLSTSRPALPSFLVLAEPTAAGVSLRPIFGPAPDSVDDPRWPSRVLALGAGIAPAGAFIFSLEGAFVGGIVAGPDGPALVPADALLTEASRAGERRTAPVSIGVHLQRLDAALATALGASDGVAVADVEPDGPAAGRLEPGDVVTALAGTPVRAPEELLLRIATADAGATFDLEVIRAGSPVHVQVPGTASPATLPAAPGPATAARAVSAPAGLGANLRASPRGALVTRVDRGSAAERAGLRAGDTISWLQGAGEASPQAIARWWRGAAAGARVALRIERDGPLLLPLVRP